MDFLIKLLRVTLGILEVSEIDSKTQYQGWTQELEQFFCHVIQMRVETQSIPYMYMYVCMCEKMQKSN